MSNQNLNILTAEEIAKKGMTLVKDGSIRNHKLKNSARVHTGTMEEKEYHTYRRYLPSKNCCMVFELTGSDNYE